MKLLILTQKMDKEDPVLGFFHNWVGKMSEKFEKVSVICLEKGECSLPDNVKVFSLGKETGRSKIKYVKNFFNLILGLHREYNAVFVHMNQEYVLLGGFVWKILGKKVFLWRNHPQGGFLTRLAVWLSDKVFCTSKFSYTARFSKTKIMPAGIEMERFKDLKKERLKNSILFLGRMSPIKRPDLLIDALHILNKRKSNFEASFYGDPLPKDNGYYEGLKEKVKKLGLEDKAKFYGGVPNYETPAIYNSHEIFVNLTSAGSFDKTILEAAACGCILAVANKSLEGEIDGRMILEEETPEALAERLAFWLNSTEEDRTVSAEKLKEYVLKKHSLGAMISHLSEEIR